MTSDFFPPRPETKPTIYAYADTHPQYAGLLKVGYTTGDVRKRVAQQYPTKPPDKPPYSIRLEEPAMRNDGTTFTDRDVHHKLIEWGVAAAQGGAVGAAYLGSQGDEWDAQKDMALATVGAIAAMLITAAVNWRFQRDFAREWAESLRVKRPRPLGEDSLARSLRKQR